MLVDLSELPVGMRRSVDEVVRRDYDLTVLKALEEQKRAAKFWRDNPARGVDGIGELKMQVHPVFYAMHQAARGQDVWSDEDWVRYFLKHSPECQVASRPGKVMVTGLGGLGGKGRRVKSWG